MKKSLLALAVLGAFAGAASAQSSVTVYGSIDMAVAKSNGGTSGNNGNEPGTPAVTKAWNLQQSNGSRLGFRGNEDLGGGLSAQFQIEHRFLPDTGAVYSATSFWQGRSYVQLTSASAGRVYLGRDYSPAFWPAVKTDPFGWDGVGQLGGMQFAGFADNSGVRVSNTVGYKSPSWGGLTVQAAVGLGEGVLARDSGFNIEYGAGPIYAAMGYGKLTGGPVATNDANSLVNFAFMYDVGIVKPFIYYARAKVSGGTLTNKNVDLGLTAPIGGGTLKAAWGRVDPEGPTNNTTKVAVGYDYPLSKRTNLYGDLGVTRTDLLTRNTTYALGVKHTF